MKKITLFAAALLLFSTSFVFAQVSDKFTYLNAPFNTAYNLPNIFPDPIRLVVIDRSRGNIGEEIKSYILTYTQKVPEGGFDLVITRVPYPDGAGTSFVKIPLVADGQPHLLEVSVGENQEAYIAPHSWNPNTRTEAPAANGSNGGKPVKPNVAPPAPTSSSFVIFGVNCTVQSL
jgi:hypothetical protein